METMAGDRVDCGAGVFVRRATQADWDELLATMREGDRAEHDALGGGRIEIGVFAASAAVVHETAGLLGVWGTEPFHANPALSPTRAWCYLSTENAWKVRREYVRASRPVVRELWRREAPWVEVAAVIPQDDYAMSNNWLRKCLRARTLGERFVEGGKWHTWHYLVRGEV